MDQPYREIEARQALRGVLYSARSVTGARCGVMTLQDDAGQVRDFLSPGLTPEESGRVRRMPEGMGIHQALTGVSEPLGVPGPAEHMESLGSGDCTVALPTVALPVEVLSVLAAPIARRGARVGRIFLGLKEDGGEGVQPGRESLVTFAARAALVIANSRTHQQERRVRAGLETLIDTCPAGVAVCNARTWEPSGTCVVGELSIDYAQRRVTQAGGRAELTAAEYAVLCRLAAQ